MSYTIDNLDARLKDYLSANKDQLITDAIFNSRSSKLFSLQTGVTNPTAIVRLDTSVQLADAKNCGFDPTPSDTFSNRILTPAFIKLNKEYCAKDFLNTWKAADIRMGATKENGGMPFEQQIVEQNIKAVGAELEKMLWMGNTTSGTGNLSLMDGIITKVDAEIASGVIPAENVIAAGSDNLVERVNKLWAAVKPNVADKVSIVMSVSNYKNYLLQLAETSNYHLIETYEGEYRMRLPFANVDIRGIDGLEGSNYILAMDLAEVFYGVDYENDTEDVDLFYDKTDRTFKLIIEFAAAVNYVIPENVYINK